VIGEPPALSGAVQDNEILPSTAIPMRLVGGSARARGDVGGDATDQSLDESEFTAATRNMYTAPFVRPVTVADVRALTPSWNVVQVAPSSADTWTV
jgi:hypothetical protein